MKFEEADEEWLEFVRTNRNGTYKGEVYDIVFGKVANDKVYRTLAFYENGDLNVEETLLRLKPSVLEDQILFHTAKSLEFIRFVKSEVQDNE